MAALVAILGVLGAAVGSFLNVVIHRLPEGQSVIRPRSRCPGCQTPVTGRDNVPVLSWLLLRGRCRSCGMRISARYPLVEALCAACFVAVPMALGLDADLLWALPFVAMLLCVAAIDLDHHIIPNRIVGPFAIYGVAVALGVRRGDLMELAIAAVAAAGFLLAAALARPGGMGLGDVKLAGVMGLYLGLSVIPAMLIAFLVGSLVGVGIMAKGGLDKRKTGIPFGPYLAFGGIVATLVGPGLIDLYADAFLR